MELVLVTGGTGFIARWCIVQLLDLGYSVRTTVRSLGREGDVRAAVGEVVARADDRLEMVVADLLDDAGWAAAVSGCRYVVHPASPLGGGDADAMIEAARGGALRVLAAACDAGVSRVVLTSAANASSPTSYETPGVTDETLWTDPDAEGLDGYRRSKTLAELAAWDFVRSRGDGGSTTLTTILPGAVVGPVLGTDNLGSVQVIGRLLRGEVAPVPRIGLEIVDVRDVADAHVCALTAEGAAGERVLATGDLLWMPDIAVLLRAELGADADRVSTETVSDDEMRQLARDLPAFRGVLPGLGRRNRHSTEKARRILGWSPRPGTEAVLDCARSLLAHGAA